MDVKLKSRNTLKLSIKYFPNDHQCKKEKYFLKLGQRLSNPANGVKAYWSTDSIMFDQHHSGHRHS